MYIYTYIYAVEPVCLMTLISWTLFIAQGGNLDTLNICIVSGKLNTLNTKYFTSTLESSSKSLNKFSKFLSFAGEIFSSVPGKVKYFQKNSFGQKDIF